MESYVITTHLIDNPKITFYYKGTANEEGVSFAMNTIVGFDISDAMVFHDKEDAIQNYLNLLFRLLMVTFPL